MTRWYRSTLWALAGLTLGCKEAPPRPVPGGATEQAPALEGQAAPEVTLALSSGESVRLSSLRGKHVVLFFYPEDQTRGCTIEARGFRDAIDAFRAQGAVVFGASMQDAASHDAFIAAEALPFELVVDAGGEVARAFGVAINGSRTARETVLIDPSGKVQKIWRSVSPSEHATEVLAELTRGRTTP